MISWLLPCFCEKPPWLRQRIEKSLFGAHGSREWVHNHYGREHGNQSMATSKQTRRWRSDWALTSQSTSRRLRKLTRDDLGFENLKACPQWHPFFNRATAPNASQTVPPAADWLFKQMSLLGVAGGGGTTVSSKPVQWERLGLSSMGDMMNFSVIGMSQFPHLEMGYASHNGLYGTRVDKAPSHWAQYKRATK